MEIGTKYSELNENQNIIWKLVVYNKISYGRVFYILKCLQWKDEWKVVVWESKKVGLIRETK